MSDAGVGARRVALAALQRIDDGAFANIAVPAILADSDLAGRDRSFVTELVYGTVRRQRSCDWLVDRFLMDDAPPALRRSLRLGAYQVQFTAVPAHAAVSATVSASPRRFRGVVNAVLRRVVDAGPPEWPSVGVELSYPDWIVARLEHDLGEEIARAALAKMNEAPPVTERPDGYVQDPASQWVGDLVGAEPGERILDLCAAPGGKTTAMAAPGVSVVAIDARHRRARLVRANVERLGSPGVSIVVADGAVPPFGQSTFDRVLVDAPCSGLGALRRRQDARWRIAEDDVGRLAELQTRLLASAAEVVRPGGLVVYSVCTLTDAETVDVAATAPPELEAQPVLPADRWTGHGSGGRILPQDHDTDGMAAFVWRRRGPDRTAPPPSSTG